MYERLESCPACGNQFFTNKIITKDYLVSLESFVIVQCNQCQLQFTNPRPKGQELSKYYQSDEYISHSNKSKNITAVLYKIARYFTLKWKLKIVEKYHKKGTLLDYGCGTGLFLDKCKKAGWNIDGVEPDNDANKLATKNTSESIALDIDNLAIDQTYDIITLWHVLEHVPNLRNTLKGLKNRLKKNGRLIIAVPNVASYDAQYYQEYWSGYDVPRHLYHFDKSSMIMLMKQEKFVLVEMLPMKLDGYYVSLLSEEYKGNKGLSKFYHGFINGYKSNKYAIKNEQNYSSIIYVFRKG